MQSMLKNGKIILCSIDISIIISCSLFYLLNFVYGFVSLIVVVVVLAFFCSPSSKYCINSSPPPLVWKITPKTKLCRIITIKTNIIMVFRFSPRFNEKLIKFQLMVWRVGFATVEIFLMMQHEQQQQRRRRLGGGGGVQLSLMEAKIICIVFMPFNGKTFRFSRQNTPFACCTKNTIISIHQWLRVRTCKINKIEKYNISQEISCLFKGFDRFSMNIHFKIEIEIDLF